MSVVIDMEHEVSVGLTLYRLVNGSYVVRDTYSGYVVVFVCCVACAR